MNISPEIRQLQSDIAFLRGQNTDLTSDLQNLGNQVTNILETQINTPPAPVSNLLYNGELGHSVNSWFETAYAAADKSKECAFWFSHTGGESVTLNETDGRTSATNQTLKKSDHSSYSASYARWNAANGWAEITGTKTLDALLPSNFVDATTPLARVSLIAAKRNKFIEIPSDCRMYAGIYDNTAGQLKYLTGTLGFSAELIGAPAASTVERRFRIEVVTDRGFSLLSPEVIVTNAPADGFFSETQNIAMTWKPTAGQLKVNVFEYVPSLTRYRQIAEVSSAFSYIYQGAYLDKTITGYPVVSTSERKAIYYTKTGELSGVATNAVSPQWDTINFPIAVPDDYDKSATTGRQFLRIGLTVAANLFVTGCTSTGTTTITAPEDAFESEYSALYAGLTCNIYDSADVLLLTTTVVSRTSGNALILGATIPAGTNLKLRIVAGGFHAVFADKIHLGFQQNTSYAPNAQDNRALQPVAAPTSGTQGTTGVGGSGGGIENCIGENSPVKLADGSRKRVKWCRAGDNWDSGELRPNLLLKLRSGYENVREVRAANGCWIECTESERFVCDRYDSNGTPLYRLRVGDTVLTEIDGRITSSKIIYISHYLGKQSVYTPTLANSRLFIAGNVRLNWRQKIAVFFQNVMTGKKEAVGGGFLLHNAKNYQSYYTVAGY